MNPQIRAAQPKSIICWRGPKRRDHPCKVSGWSNFDHYQHYHHYGIEWLSSALFSSHTVASLPPPSLPSKEWQSYLLGKHLSMSHHLYLGIAQIAITPLPPHSNGHSGALFFRRDFTFLPFLPFFLPFFYHFLWISAPNHPGKGLDPPKIKQMPIWTWKILL